jgi:multimeric flavodoxin WrbA
MNKKILMVSGSPRKNGDGAKVLKELESIFMENTKIECEYLFLRDYKLEPCRGCLVCTKVKGNKCPIKDDISKILEKFNESDGFVFISPVYVRMVSAQMKLLFDRTSFLLHRPVHAGKVAILMCTASFAGRKQCLNFLKIPVGNMGMHIVGSIGISSYAYKNKKEYKDKVFAQLNNTCKKYTKILFSLKKPKPSLGQLLIFNKWKHLVMYRKKETPGDFQFWENNDLLNKDYYYPTKINPVLKRLIPFIVKKVMKRLNKKFGLF